MQFVRAVVFTGAVLALTGCASTAPPIITGEAAPGADLLLRGTASGNWNVECDAVTERGTAHSEMKGHGSTSTDIIAMRDIESASCTYQAGNAPLTLTLEEEGLVCPFGEYEDGICRTVLSASSQGTIAFARIEPVAE